MTTDFTTDSYNHSNFESKRAEFSLSSAHGSFEKSRCRFSALSNLEKLKLERQIRNCVAEKASQGDYAVAIALLDELIALRPDSATNYNNRGLMHFRNNQITEAVADLSQAVKINPKLDSAYNNRGNCYAARGELVEALADYDVALDLNPANLRAWINQGVTFREVEMYNLAIENFDIALIIGNRLHDRIYAERGRSYHLRGDWNCAVADYQQALEILALKPKLEKFKQKVEMWLAELLAPLGDL